ncbi:MAG: cydD [Herbaspirillum sp.]|nr:cydD [Herbaspirillum sp.]
MYINYMGSNVDSDPVILEYLVQKNVNARIRSMRTTSAADQRLRRHAGNHVGNHVGMLLQTAASLLWLPQAGLLAHAIQEMTDGAGGAAIPLSAASILALGLVRTWCDVWGGRLVFKAARAGLSRLREQAVRSLAGRSPMDAERPASGLAASVIAEQAEAVLPYLTRYRSARLRATIVPLAIVVAVLPFSWIAALILLVAAPVIPLFMALVGWRAQEASEAQMLEIGGMNAFLLDRLRGLAALRTLGAVDITALRLRDAAQSLRRRTMAVLRIAFLSSAILELFSALGVAMAAVYIGFHLLGELHFGAWGKHLSLGQGLFILLLAPAFFEPLREVAGVWHDRAAGEAALNALDRLMVKGWSLPEREGARECSDAVAPGVAECAAPAVLIRDLQFSYPGAGAPVFDGYGLHVAAGEKVAVMAVSGAGKSTLLSLIAGMAPAQGGVIAIGGVPLSAATAAGLRARMAWIGQKPHIFAGSVRANVALGRPDVGPAQIASTLRFASLDRVPQAHPGIGLSEGGGGLSGGEAVRLALARAAAHPGAKLLLVDEPTAHLDRATARQVTDALLQLAQGKTMIVATHDPVLAARMDRVIALDTVTDAKERA